MGALPPSPGGPFASLGFMGARKPFDGPGSPLVATKMPSSFLGGHEAAHHPLLPSLSSINRHREPLHPILPTMRPPFIHPSLYPALASLGGGAAAAAAAAGGGGGYPPSMASFHSVLASLSAYRPGGAAGPVPEMPDYAALLRAAAAAPPSASPPSADEARARIDSANDLRVKAREFELKLEKDIQTAEN